ncbi:hypothetical protein BCR34DRAFT_626151 [Clohesyomyces aquaticus]|uniref:Uncharacterized protein n=1 Tax=Clohesyomyces aquaticus TaxID=1231657 RepID=A0A1Y1ZEI2_9PLEO|nr:hypothetical protein BCR34DRAFT_626151 [Clohesyomyces aquaticus]
MPGIQSGPYTLLESSFRQAPTFKSHKSLPRRRGDDLRGVFPATDTEPLKADPPDDDDDTLSQVSSHDRTPLASPGALNGADSGLPPTPPSNSQEERPSTTFSPPPHADGVVSSLLSKNSTLSTPVNQRSPPTPDPSPPRTTESMPMALPERPNMFAYPSSRAESFTTAREEQGSSEGGDSRVNSPPHMADRLSAVEEERGLGLAFEREDSDATPTNRIQRFSGANGLSTPERKDPLDADAIPDREWNTELMRNVTVRRKWNPRPQHKELDSVDTAAPARQSSSPRRASSLRQRVEASQNSPITPDIENFAHSIGWPSEVNSALNEQLDDIDPKRLSGSSMTSAVVEAKIIVTPPQRRRTLRHSGKNLAYIGDGSPPAQSSASRSNRNSLNSDDASLHRLVHKKANIPGRRRVSVESDTLASYRTASPLSIRKRGEESAAYTLKHQESVRNVLQPAAEILSRTESTGWRAGGVSSITLSSKEWTVTRTEERTVPRMEESTEESTRYEQGPATIASAVQRHRAEEPRKAVFQPDGVIDQERPQEERKVSGDSLPIIKRGSSSLRGRSDERRRSSASQDRSSNSRDTLHPHGLDRIPTEELPRHSHEWHSLHPDDHRRISFDRSTARTEEHAMARHLYAQGTPFSQFSDTPSALEVSEATAVSIYPHNNHSLLVVQQVAQLGSQPQGARQVANDLHVAHSDLLFGEMPSSSPQASNTHDEYQTHEELMPPENPTLTFEPSTPPMQLLLPNTGAVDSPLKNPRQAPEPPIIKFIPPTPAEELERQLPPGPPEHSEFRPQRRLSLVQRARRYSDNLISPLLARASSTRGRASDSHTHENPRVPNVSDEDGTLHPFWRPRGFWDGFDDSDSEDEDDVLPQGGDTSDIPDPEPEPPKTGLTTLKRRLTNSVKGSSGFLIGNSLGLDRAGTNKRRPHVQLPSRRASASAAAKPKLVIQPPTLPLRARSVSPHANSLRAERRSRKDEWRKGKKIPGLGGRMQIQYIGLSGVRERWSEKRKEKRRESIRRSIGTRYYVEGGMA